MSGQQYIPLAVWLTGYLFSPILVLLLPCITSSSVAVYYCIPLCNESWFKYESGWENLLCNINARAPLVSEFAPVVWKVDLLDLKWDETYFIPPLFNLSGTGPSLVPPLTATVSNTAITKGILKRLSNYAEPSSLLLCSRPVRYQIISNDVSSYRASQIRHSLQNTKMHVLYLPL